MFRPNVRKTLHSPLEQHSTTDDYEDDDMDDDVGDDHEDEDSDGDDDAGRGLLDFDGVRPAKEERCRASHAAHRR